MLRFYCEKCADEGKMVLAEKGERICMRHRKIAPSIPSFEDPYNVELKCWECGKITVFRSDDDSAWDEYGSCKVDCSCGAFDWRAVL